MTSDVIYNGRIESLRKNIGILAGDMIKNDIMKMLKNSGMEKNKVTIEVSRGNIVMKIILEERNDI